MHFQDSVAANTRSSRGAYQRGARRSPTVRSWGKAKVAFALRDELNNSYSAMTRRPTSRRSALSVIPRPSSRTPSPRHLLLVEDEPTLARVLTLVLTTSGYTVTWCADGAEALETFRTMPDPVDLVVSDVTMPRLSGDQLARALHEIQPDLPVILMTGFSNMVTSQHARTLGVAALLEKPIDIDDLLATIESVCERVQLEA